MASRADTRGRARANQFAATLRTRAGAAAYTAATGIVEHSAAPGRQLSQPSAAGDCSRAAADVTPAAVSRSTTKPRARRVGLERQLLHVSSPGLRISTTPSAPK